MVCWPIFTIPWLITDQIKNFQIRSIQARRECLGLKTMHATVPLSVGQNVQLLLPYPTVFTVINT